MALTTYNQLREAVKDWLGRANDTAYLTSDRVDDLVQIAEGEIYTRLRVRQLEATAALTVSAQSVALPADFIELRRLYLTTTPLRYLEYRAPVQFWREYAAGVAGQPRGYTIEASNVLFGPAPDATYTAQILYYRRPQPLVMELNALFTAFPDVFLYGALAHSAAFVGEDERMPVWRQFFADALARAQEQSDRSVSGAPLVMRPF